jgi:hypothetical protein
MNISGLRNTTGFNVSPLRQRTGGYTYEEDMRACDERMKKNAEQAQKTYQDIAKREAKSPSFKEVEHAVGQFTNKALLAALAGVALISATVLGLGYMIYKGTTQKSTHSQL